MSAASSIVLDAGPAAKRERTGIARYVVRLTEALLAVAPERRLTLALRLSRLRRRRHVFRPRGGGVAVRWFQEPFSSLTLPRHDVFHGTDARLPRGLKSAGVVTIHDLGGAFATGIQSERFRRRKRAALADAVARARLVVCVSEGTRRELLERFDLRPGKVRVVHHGVDARFRPIEREEAERAVARLGVRPPYALFVGLVSERKNLRPLLAAHARLRAEGADLRLVLAGGRGRGAEELLAQASADVVLPGYVPDDLLPSLYAAASVFVFPGLHEGFGLPMLEAMACATPVVAADRPVSREVCGDAALLVDTRSEREIAEALRRILGENDLRERLVARGLERAAGFRWEETARRTLAIYDEAVS